MDTKKKNNEIRLNRKYQQILRNKVIKTFAPFYCSNMNIDIFDNNSELPCDIHNDVSINSKNYEILMYIKNIVTWVDNKFGLDNKNVIQKRNKKKSTYKTSYIHNRDTTTRLYLHCQSNCNKQNYVENLDEDKMNSTLMEIDMLSSSSATSNGANCEQLSSNSMFEEEQANEITKEDLCSAIFRKYAVVEKKTSQRRSPVNTNDEDISNTEQEINGDDMSEKLFNLGLGTSAIGYDSSSVNEISNKIKLSKTSLASGSITRKRFNTRSYFENESKRKKLNESFFSDNEESNSNNDSNKVDEITKGDLCSTIFRRSAVLESEVNKNKKSMVSAQESNDDVNSESVSNFGLGTSKTVYSSSVSEQSRKKVNLGSKNTKVLKNALPRKLNKTSTITSLQHRNEPNSSNNDELNVASSSTTKVSKKLNVQTNKEKTQSHSASPKKNSAKKKNPKNMYLRNEKGETRLHIACAKGNYNLVSSLLSQGFNPNVKDNAGWTPMHDAVKMGCLNVIKELIKYGAYLNAPGFEYETPLYTAIKHSKNDVAALLLQNGADTKCINIYGKSARSINEDNWSKLLKNYKIPSKPLQQNRTYALDKITVFLSDSSLNKVTVDTFCNLFDIKVIKDVDKIGLLQVTHIVVPETKNNTCELNLECLTGIANGLFIVNENWIIDSLKAKKIVDSENYEVVGTSSSLTNGPKKSRLNKEKLCPKLFDGINIHISGNTGWKQFSLSELNKLVLQFGGNVLKRMPNPEDCASNIIPYHCHNSEKMYYVSNIILYTKESNRLIKYNMKHLKAYPVSWFIEAGQKHSII
ncbi:BRCT domain,Ankyrin repeat-containing domain,Ankyrin repeat [Cinara cedri]|uniref:BRCT domain,Ankyrin repeat-containing domain,Ankyrin repeat n=1 Tax=Cinara cedri TaxID=506608 RepID=A0A5E4N0U6_9HEMI|nr:BRCT domain,Ankyrin repeat-containing domain,Ankyrin repeat [Cinara cedri]